MCVKLCASKLNGGSLLEHPSAVRLSCDYCHTPVIYLWSLLVVLGHPQTM